MAGCGQVAERPERETAALSTHVLYCTGKNLIIVKQIKKYLIKKILQFVLLDKDSFQIDMIDMKKLQVA